MGNSPVPQVDWSKAQPITPQVDWSKATPVRGVSEAEQQQKDRLITPIEGESFADTMHRAVEMGKTVTPEELAAQGHGNLKKVPTVLGAALLAGPALVGGAVIGPQAASSALGGGMVGGAAGGATSGASISILEKFLRAAGGENVMNMDTLKDITTAATAGGITGGVMGLFEQVAGSLLGSKVARGAINSSVGATARDVTYGNPAVGIMKAGVTSPLTGDLEAYKTALRAGATPDQALLSAGGRVAQVAQKVQTLTPQLDSLLQASPAQIRVADVIDRPLQSAASEIINNRAMTDAEKDVAIKQLGALQHSLKDGLGPTISPLQANQIKQAIGNRVNWAGDIAVTDEVKPAYRAVYGALKNEVNNKVPGAAQINEDLTNLLSAQTDLEKLMKAEEAGQGKGALGSSFSGIARRAEAGAGRVIPAANAVNNAAQKATPTAAGVSGASIADILRSKGVQLPQAQQISPGVPFHPNQGQP